MGTTIKIFNFVTDEEGWIANPGNGRVNMSVYHRNRNSLRINPTLAEIGKCLKTSSKHNNSQQVNSWNWTGTWQDLGVPSGATVTSVQGSYLYRWDMGKTRGHQTVAEWTLGECKVGPFKLYTGGLSLLGTFSNAVNAPARTSLDQWRAYPLGTNLDPIVLEPISWAKVTGTISSLALSSSDSLNLILSNQIAATALWSYGDPAKNIILKQDRIQLDITYTIPAPSGLFLLF